MDMARHRPGSPHLRLRSFRDRRVHRPEVAAGDRVQLLGPLQPGRLGHSHIRRVSERVRDPWVASSVEYSTTISRPPGRSMSLTDSSTGALFLTKWRELAI